MQFVPLAIASAWLLWYWWPRRRTWDWLAELPLLVAVSLVVMPYGWGFDFALFLLPAVALFAVGWRWLPGREVLVRLLLPFVGISMVALIQDKSQGNLFWDFWMAPALLLWYLWGRANIRRAGGSESLL